MLEKDNSQTTQLKKKIAYKMLSLMNIGTKILNEIPTNQFQC